MANPTDPPSGHFRAELDDGQIVESDGSTITDPDSGAAVTAVVLRMTRPSVLTCSRTSWRTGAASRWSSPRCAPPKSTERALAWTLEAGAAAAGDPEAGRCTPRGSLKCRQPPSGSPR